MSVEGFKSARCPSQRGVRLTRSVVGTVKGIND